MYLIIYISMCNMFSILYIMRYLAFHDVTYQLLLHGMPAVVDEDINRGVCRLELPPELTARLPTTYHKAHHQMRSICHPCPPHV